MALKGYGNFMYTRNQFFLRTQPTQAKTAAEWKHHFLYLLLIIELCMHYLALLIENLKL